MLQDPQLRVPFAIALGAIVGALSRYYVTLGCHHWLGSPLYGTFIVNLVGAWAMGLFTTLMVVRLSLPRELALLVGTGFLGSLTTFSTYTLDVATLVAGRMFHIALFYWLGSAVLGVISLYLGVFTARVMQ